MQQANWHSNCTGNSRVILLVEDHDIYREECGDYDAGASAEDTQEQLGGHGQQALLGS